MCLLIMETNVVIADQYDQFCVGGVSEHPVEAAHVILPVLQRNTERERKNVSDQASERKKLT